MAGAAFPKSLRLLEPQQFRAVFDGQPLRISAGEVLLLARPNALATARIGVVIGKKVCRRACDRNRFKRAVREAFRLRSAELPAADIIILARNGIADLDSGDIRQRVTTLWNRLLKRSLPASGLDCPSGFSSP